MESNIHMEVTQESLGDLPLLGYLIRSSGLVECVDEHYSVHGNWRGPSVGQMLLVWLVYILSECDHRLYNVEDWASRHIQVLRWLLDDPELEASAFQDDRLGQLLEWFSVEETWVCMSSRLMDGLVRLYDLPQETSRVDSMNATSFREPQPDSLFQFGYRKNHQANLPQLKMMLVSLDPLALPVASIIVDGKRSDDQLYIPAIEQARRGLRLEGMLYVGDTKLCNLENCAYIAGSGNYYLGPLSEVQYRPDLLHKAVLEAWADEASMQTLYKDDPKTGQSTAFARAYEMPGRERYDAGSGVRWQERLILIRDEARSESQYKKLLERLRKAQQEIIERFLPRKYRQVWKPGQEAEAQAFIDKVLTTYKVKEFLQAELVQPADGRTKEPIFVRLSVQEEKLHNAQLTAGWRIFAANAPRSRLDTKDVLPCYREEYRIEQQFHKLLTKTTNLVPIYLKNENRIVAMLRVLTMALQFIAIMQYDLRKEMEAQNEVLQDIVPGNKSRKVEKPTAESVLRRFCPISAVWVKLPQQPLRAFVTNFDPVHRKVLRLLKIPEDLYENVVLAFHYVNELE